MLTQLFTSLVEEELASISYDATLAGLHYSLGTERAGILLAVSGYTDKLPLLARIVMAKMRTLKLDGEEFSVVHDRLSRAYANAKLANPYSLADIELKRFTRSTFWTYEERFEALQQITREDVLRHAETVLQHAELDVLVHGNFAPEVCRFLRFGATGPAADNAHFDRTLQISSECTTRCWAPHRRTTRSSIITAACYFQKASLARRDKA